MITSAASGPLGHVALVHEDPERAEDLARLLRTAGHRVTVVVPGRRIVQGVVDCSPDLLLASHSLVDPPMASVVKGVRQALGADVRILVLYGFDPQGVPAEVDDVQRAEPLQPTELSIRVSRLLQELAERRVLQKKTSELLGLYKMSWAFSLAGGADALYAHLSRHSAEMLKAERGLVMLYDGERRQLVGPGARLRAHARAGAGACATRSTARPTGAGTSARTGRCLSNKAQADTRLLPELVSELGPAVPDGRADHARPQDPGAAGGGRSRGPGAVLGRGPEPADRPRRPGHDRGREPAPPRGDQEGQPAAAGVRPAEERVRRDRGARLPPAADGDPRLRRARGGGARPAARDPARVHAHGDQRDRPPGAARQRHAADHADRDRPAELQLPRGGRRPVPARGGPAGALGPLGADGRAGQLPEDLGRPRSPAPGAQQPRLERRSSTRARAARSWCACASAARSTS